MVETVKELLVYKDDLYRTKEEVLALKKQLEEKKTVRKAGERILPEEPGSESKGEEIGALYGKADFDRMEHEILSKKLYADPNFSREELLKIVYIPKNKFAQFFKQHAGMSFTKYISNMRLEYAARLLEDYPNYTIEAIAADCGIPAKATFYRLFFEKFGITPVEFRKEIARRK